jgi:phenylalanyl-tRNA synthetase alpha chain
LEFFFQEILGPQTQVRFRPHFFPFTEPSFEIDIKLEAKGQEAKWIEIAGCGMVDPAVFEAVCSRRRDALFDPNEVMGFAFGLGLDRLAMILHGITDIRHLIENDVRFLGQF